MARTETSKDNLCSTCKKCIADCNSKELEFGDGVGNDNVICCDAYETED